MTDRREGLGASDAPAALGISPWKTPLTLFLEKLGQLPQQPTTLAMHIGKALEPIVLETFSLQTGMPVRRQQQKIIDPANPWRWATLDGIANGAIVEAKTSATAHDFGEEGTDEIPQPYIIQIQHQFAVTGFVLAYVPVLIAGRDFKLYQVERDDELIELITESEREFWGRVERQEPPDPVTLEDVQLRYRISRAIEVEAPYEIAMAALHLALLRGQMKTHEMEEKQLELFIKRFMGEADTLVYQGKPLATWRQRRESHQFDKLAFREAHPQIYEQFIKTSPGVRTFLLKGPKE
jgi:putative phage-type endonuclease